MKKIILGFCFSLALANVHAQTQKADWMVGGNFGFNTANKNTNILFTPNVGYFFADNFAAGGNVSLNYSKTGSNKYTSFGVGPFARYYFTSETQTVRPLVHASFNYVSTKNKINNTVSSTNTGSNYFLGGGAAAFISKNVSIDALMGYDHTKYKNFNGSGGFALNIGFQVYINRGNVEKLRSNL